MTRVAIISALFLIAASPSDVRAQYWLLDGYYGGGAYGTEGADVGTSNVVLGIRYQREPSVNFYTAFAAPLAEGNPAWAAMGAERRWVVLGSSRLGAGLDLGAHGHGYRDAALAAFGGGGTFEAMPLLQIGVGNVILEARSGLMHYLSEVAGTSWSRTVHSSDLTVSARQGRLSLQAEGRYLRAEEADYPFAGATLTLNAAQSQMWLMGGKWFSNSIDEPSWEAGLSLSVAPRLSIWGSYRNEAPDPLYWNAPRQTWNVGLTRTLGTAPQTLSPASAPEVIGNTVRIRLPISGEEPAPPLIGGDFNEWQPVPMQRSGSFWTIELTLASGAYHYAFKSADGNWFLPEDAVGRVPDDFGGHVALLVVP